MADSTAEIFLFSRPQQTNLYEKTFKLFQEKEIAITK
jgi:hypothetical protein